MFPQSTSLLIVLLFVVIILGTLVLHWYPCYNPEKLASDQNTKTAVFQYGLVFTTLALLFSFGIGTDYGEDHHSGKPTQQLEAGTIYRVDAAHGEYCLLTKQGGLAPMFYHIKGFIAHEGSYYLTDSGKTLHQVAPPPLKPTPAQ